MLNLRPLWEVSLAEQSAFSVGRIQDGGATMGWIWLKYRSVGFTQDKIANVPNLFTHAVNAFQGVLAFVVDRTTFLKPPHRAVFGQFAILHRVGSFEIHQT